MSASDPLLDGLAVYQVGGAVRDRLLGRPVADTDYVVVGADPETLAARGFRPVGRDFPVFLHPGTGAEYALARTERKRGRGYHGFTFHTGPEVGLEDDLARRDLTINAMAMDADGNLVDPLGGRRDLENRVLRHVSAAFVEDPVRLLRLARFAARFTDFSIAPETTELCRQMVAAGEIEHLVPERVWAELSRALMEKRPSRFLQVLAETGALSALGEAFETLWQDRPAVAGRVQAALDAAADLDAPLPARFACLARPLARPELDALCRLLRVPGDCRELARLAVVHGRSIDRAPEMDADQLVALLEALDGFRRPQRLKQLLLACRADRLARGDGAQAAAERPCRYLEAALAAAATVDAAALAGAQPSGKEIGRAVRRARSAAVAQWLAGQHD